MSGRNARGTQLLGRLGSSTTKMESPSIYEAKNEAAARSLGPDLQVHNNNNSNNNGKRKEAASLDVNEQAHPTDLNLAGFSESPPPRRLVGRIHPVGLCKVWAPPKAVDRSRVSRLLPEAKGRACGSRGNPTSPTQNPIAELWSSERSASHKRSSRPKLTQKHVGLISKGNVASACCVNGLFTEQIPPRIICSRITNAGSSPSAKHSEQSWRQLAGELGTTGSIQTPIQTPWSLHPASAPSRLDETKRWRPALRGLP